MDQAGSADWMHEIHQRLLNGDPVASAELVETLFKVLVTRLKRAFPRVRDPTLLQDAVTDALLAYLKTPASYDPSKRGLIGYLMMAAKGDLLNALARDRHRRQRETLVEDVEVVVSRGKRVSAMSTIFGRWDVDAEAAAAWARIDQVFPDALDRELAGLVVSGERSTTRFAEILSATDLSPDEQRRIVKQHKDRIKKRLRRFGEKADGRKA